MQSVALPSNIAVKLLGRAKVRMSPNEQLNEFISLKPSVWRVYEHGREFYTLSFWHFARPAGSSREG